jgi:hypothetical protein
MTLPIPTLNPPTDSFDKFWAVLCLLVIVTGIVGGSLMVSKDAADVSAESRQLLRAQRAEEHETLSLKNLEVMSKTFADSAAALYAASKAAQGNAQKEKDLADRADQIREEIVGINKDIRDGFEAEQNLVDDLQISHPELSQRVRESGIILRFLMYIEVVSGIGLVFFARRWNSNDNLKTQYQQLQNQLIRTQIAETERRISVPKASDAPAGE